MYHETQSNNSSDDPEVVLMENEGTALFKQILEGRNGLYDYTTSSLKFGGYNHRQICSIFKITNIVVNFLENDIVIVESPQKTIRFENGKLYIYTNPVPRFS